MTFRTVALTFTLLSVTFVLAQSHKSKGPSPDEPVIHDYVLTMAKLNKYADAAKVAQKAVQQDPAMAAEMKKIEDTDVYAVEKVKMIENSPHLMKFISSQGMTAHDFVFLPLTLVTASLAKYGQDQGAKMPAFVNPVNIQFVRQHEAEIKKLNLTGGDSGNDAGSDAENDNDSNQ